jgi:hypothetical protein
LFVVVLEFLCYMEPPSFIGKPRKSVHGCEHGETSYTIRSGPILGKGHEQFWRTT